MVEKVYKVGGMYGAIERIVGWLEKAAGVAKMATKRGNQYPDTLLPQRWFENFRFNIKWVQDLTLQIDFVNGFTENYGDPSWVWKQAGSRSSISKDPEATKRTEIISQNAQWFEDNSPTDKKFKKETVKAGVSPR